VLPPLALPRFAQPESDKAEKARSAAAVRISLFTFIREFLLWSFLYWQNLPYGKVYLTSCVIQYKRPVSFTHQMEKQRMMQVPQ
jgi:hypothetical protein